MYIYQGASWNDLVGMEYENVSYNIFCNHGKFDYPQMSKVMGSRERTKYITMIRDPVELFISAWYYSIHKGYKMTLGMNLYISLHNNKADNFQMSLSELIQTKLIGGT